MKEKQDYIKDIAEIRQMMERSSKFLSLSGWAGIMAGLYALAGAYIAYKMFYFVPKDSIYGTVVPGLLEFSLAKIMILAIVVLALALGTAIYLCYRKGMKRGESIWNTASKQLLLNMFVPLATGGVLILILISKNILGLVAPLTLLFYGLALFNAGKFTYREVRYLGLIQIGLGLLGSYFIGYGLVLWALGFGVVHIVYGIYIYLRYER